MTIESANKHRAALINLLQNENLPAADLPQQLADFVAAIEGNELIGAAGLERYGKCGLLRSVVVAANKRGQGIAGRLIAAIEVNARKNGVRSLFLLTESAADYFGKKGYKIVDRDEVPDTVKQSSQFSHVCPVSAIVMKKNLSESV